MPTIVVVLDHRRLERHPSAVGELGGERVRAGMQAWLDARNWVMDSQVRELGARTLSDGPVQSVAWEVRGPTDAPCERWGWLAPGDIYLCRDETRFWFLFEQSAALGIRQIAVRALRASGV